MPRVACQAWVNGRLTWAVTISLIYHLSTDISGQDILANLDPVGVLAPAFDQVSAHDVE